MSKFLSKKEGLIKLLSDNPDKWFSVDELKSLFKWVSYEALANTVYRARRDGAGIVCHEHKFNIGGCLNDAREFTVGEYYPVTYKEMHMFGLCIDKRKFKLVPSSVVATVKDLDYIGNKLPTNLWEY